MLNLMSSLTRKRASLGEKGSSQTILLLVLALLLAVFGYLYFFTDIIKSRPTATLPPPPAQVKQAIPARPEGGGEVKPSGTTPVPTKPDDKTAAVPPAAPAAAPAVAPSAAPTAAKPAPATTAAPAKPAAAPPAAPAAQTAAKPAPAQAVAPAKQPTATSAAPAAAKPAPAAVAAKPAAAPAASAKPAPAVKEGQTKAADTKPAAKQAKPAGGAYTLLVGEYVVEKSVAPVQAKLKKLDIGPVTKTKIKRSEPMNRLFLATYDDRQAAESALDKLKKDTGDGFMLPENGKYTVYAGSFFMEGKAAIEQDRLYEKGYKLVMKKSTAMVPVVRITAGSYASKDDARKDLDRLKKSGIAAQVVKSGK
jgi:hypothetical protein